MTRHRILIAEDERINQKILTELLEEEHDVIIAKNGEEVLMEISNNLNIDLILLDIIMPGMNGYEVLKRLKEIPQVKDIPVIFITGLTSVGYEEKGLKLGAADYIAKPFNPGLVKLRVANHLRFVRQRKLLETLVGHDGLTEIYNRRYFNSMIEKEWNRTQRNHFPLSIVMIDVDFFKKYNDHYGHASGDKVLKLVAKTLSMEMRRPGDLAARYGGEEFVLVIPDIKKEDAIKLAEKVRISIENLKILHETSEVAGVITVSMGGATSEKNDLSPEELIKAADKKLYEAKKQGRNRVLWR